MSENEKQERFDRLKAWLDSYLSLVDGREENLHPQAREVFFVARKLQKLIDQGTYTADNTDELRRWIADRFSALDALDG